MRRGVTSGKRRNATNVPVNVCADQFKRTVAFLDLTAAPRGEYRDDVIAHLRDLRHQRQHFRAGNAQNRGLRRGAVARVKAEVLDATRWVR